MIEAKHLRPTESYTFLENNGWSDIRCRFVATDLSTSMPSNTKNGKSSIKCLTIDEDYVYTCVRPQK